METMNNGLINSIETFISNLAGLLWDTPMLILIFACGLLFTVRTRCFQITNLGYILKNTIFNVFSKKTKENNKKNEGVMTPFQALSTALAGSVGNANIAGVATALAVGGPGAVFWMSVVAFFGMITKLVEVTLAVHFRRKDENGNFYGGPMYYIEDGLGKKWIPLAKFFSLMMVIGALGTAVFVQPSTMATTLYESFEVPPILTIIVAVCIAAVVLIGGFKRIGRFCEMVTPFMCGLYLLTGFGILVTHFYNIPSAIGLIFSHALQPTAAVGGFVGSTVAEAMKRGVARGTFSNEAGMGSAPMVHATAKTDHPVRQGLYGSAEVFIDTLIVCNMTALTILCVSPDLWSSGLSGSPLTMAAFTTVYGTLGKIVVTSCSVLFALSTMIGYYIEFETSSRYLMGPKAFKFFRFIYFIPPFLTLYLTHDAIWDVVDISTGIVVIPNIIALILLSGTFTKIFNDYTRNVQLKEKALLKK